MAFVDELNVKIKAGDGGNGVVRFRHEKGREFMGPSGGNGGNGGDVYVVGVRDSGLLFKYRHEDIFEAEDGENGRDSSEFGAGGEDLEIKFPVGSIITNKETGESVELLLDGQKELILKGGRGGFGNEHFKGSTNQTPQESTDGKPGQEAEFYIELSLIADVGFIGLPNAGKSSLLNALTHAKAKVGNFNFTTLDPNLGDLYGVILADIPGLIEGAADGKGLGHKFLRHVSRTKMLLHVLSLEFDDIEKNYEVIRKELFAYDETISEKEELIVLAKSDLVGEDVIDRNKELFESKGKKVFIISIDNKDSLKELSDYLVQTLK